MDLKSLTLDQFLSVPNLTITSSVVDQFGMMAALFRPYVGGAWHDLGAGYFLHHLGDNPGDIAVVKNGELVGFYNGQVVAVDPAHAKLGLGTALVLAAAPHRPLPLSRTLSPEGKATLTKAWMVANGHDQLRLDVTGLI